MESTSQLRCVLVCQFIVSFPKSELCYKCFSYNDIFSMTLGLRSFVVRCITSGNNVRNNVWKLRFVFVRDCDVFLFRHYYVIYLFDVVTFFDDEIFWYVRITYVNDVKTTFGFCSSLWRIFYFITIVCHCNVFFYYVTITLFFLFHVVTFLMMLELRYILVRSNYERKLRYKTVIF